MGSSGSGGIPGWVGIEFKFLQWYQCIASKRLRLI